MQELLKWQASNLPKWKLYPRYNGWDVISQCTWWHTDELCQKCKAALPSLNALLPHLLVQSTNDVRNLQPQHWYWPDHYTRQRSSHVSHRWQRKHATQQQFMNIGFNFIHLMLRPASTDTMHSLQHYWNYSSHNQLIQCQLLNNSHLSKPFCIPWCGM